MIHDCTTNVCNYSGQLFTDCHICIFVFVGECKVVQFYRWYVYYIDNRMH